MEQKRSGDQGSPRSAHEINQQAVNPPLSPQIRELGLQKIICPLAFRLNKALIAQCMMIRRPCAATWGNIMGKIASAIVAGLGGSRAPFLSGFPQDGRRPNTAPAAGVAD